MPKQAKTPETVRLDSEVLERLVHTRAEGFSLREIAAEIWPDASWSAPRDGVCRGMPSHAMYLWAALVQLVQQGRLKPGLPGPDVDAFAALRFLPVGPVTPRPSKPSPPVQDRDGRRRAFLPGERTPSKRQQTEVAHG